MTGVSRPFPSRPSFFRPGSGDLEEAPKRLPDDLTGRRLLGAGASFHGRAQPEVKAKLRSIAEQVIKEIVERLRSEVLRAFSGKRNRFRRSKLQPAANFDWRATMRANLPTYDPERKRIIAERLYFNSRERRRLPWRIILAVDQSGSMTDSIIHSAVMAAILAGLPGVDVKMVLFDTSIVDVSDRLTDPLETLLSVQLGGGTDIAARTILKYVEKLVGQRIDVRNIPGGGGAIGYVQGAAQPADARDGWTRPGSSGPARVAGAARPDAHTAAAATLAPAATSG